MEELDNAIALRVGTKWYLSVIPGTVRVMGEWVTFKCVYHGKTKQFTFKLDQITGIESR